MASTFGASVAFWNGKAAKGSSVESTGNKLYSYTTVILQRLSSGEVIGNDTKYSATTSRHQSQARIASADIIVHNVPRGEDDLRKYM